MDTGAIWRSIMHYGHFDRMPIVHWAGWPETRERWLAEGLPADVSEHEYFNAISTFWFVSIDYSFMPSMAEEVIEETDEYRIFRDSGGVVQKDWKNRSCIPTFMDFTLKEAKDWDDFKRRLQPDPARVPKISREFIDGAKASGMPIAFNTASMMGWIRNWMGVQNMCYLMFDAPEVYADMVDTIADLVCWGIDQVLPQMGDLKIDLGFGWEDICGKSGPLVSPNIFDRCVAPGYRKMRRKLESYGVTLLGVDCDGLVEPLIGNWLSAGVNLQFPIEIGTWNADSYAIRRKFGKELRIIGGFNKLVLEKDRAAIDAEIERRMPLMAEGGFVMMPDHLITPGVSLENYKYYLDRVRSLRF